MSRWTEEEFQRVAISTKLSSRTLAACRDVMVNGLSGVDAGRVHDVLPAQISRATSSLRAKHEDIEKGGSLLKSHVNNMKSYAIDYAKKLATGNYVVAEPVAGERYDGSILIAIPGFIIQKVTEPIHKLVVHDLGRLDVAPDSRKPVSIDYPHDGGTAKVTVVNLKKSIARESSGGGVER